MPLGGRLRSSLAAFAVAAAAPAGAQPFEIRWYSFDGGGTTQAAGGVFALAATIGQPDAGGAVASPFSVGSGFWAATLTTTGAELSVALTDSPDPVSLGGNLDYTLTVRNAGPADALGVTVDDATPPGLIFVSNAGDCVTAFPCSLGTLPAGQTRAITATFQVPLGYGGPNPILDTATVAAATADPNPATNTATVATAVGAASADLAVTKLGPALVFRNSDIVYSITVTNEGPSDAAGVQVSDATPPGLVFVSNAGDCVTAFPCSLGTVPAERSRVILATFRVPGGYAGPDPIVNTAAATASTPDPQPGNDSDTVQTALTTPPGLDFHTVTPCRLLDTRNPDGPLGGPALQAQATRRFVIAGACAIPVTAQAISVNVAVTLPTAPGNLRLFPAGDPVPLVSAINYAGGQTRTNNGIVGLGLGGDLDVFCGQASGAVHLILDVNGYFQ